jgi:hypothetical protein
MTEGTEDTPASAPVHAFVHTPGPWHYHGGWGQCVRASRVTVAECRTAKLTGEECEANARLIAAAPELVEALRILYDFQNGPPLEKYRDQWNDAMKLAKAALAKAGNL